MEYYPDMWAKRGRILAPLFRRECGRMSFQQTASDNVNGPSRKWCRLLQTSWSPYDIYTTSTKRLGVVITQDNWSIAFVVNSLWRAINKHHYRIRTLSQMSSTECCGDTNIRLHQPYLIKTVGQTPNRVLHIGEYLNRDMSPRSSIRADT